MSINYGDISKIRKAYGTSITPEIICIEEGVVKAIVNSKPCKFSVGKEQAELKAVFDDNGNMYYSLYLNESLVLRLYKSALEDCRIDYIAPPAGLAELEKINTIIREMTEATESGSAIQTEFKDVDLELYRALGLLNTDALREMEA